MAIPQLTPEQIRTWTLEQKDRWWLENVYRGDMPQLTVRSALTGILLGSILSLTNLYVGIRTGWTLGVGITSVILAFAVFKAFSAAGGRDFTILENNAMQSIATSAGYMTAPLTASLPAYMLVTGKTIPQLHTLLWIICLPILGVFFAFPLKKRFVNDDQLPFPEGYAAGVVMDNLHTSSGAEGVFKAKVLGLGAAASALIQLLRSEKVMHALRAPFLTIPEYLDELVYRVGITPRIAGFSLADLGIRVDSSIVMFGTGGLLGLKAGASLLVGGVLNYFILAPWMMKLGIIPGPGFRNITRWSLWWGVAMMTAASLFSFFSKPSMILGAFKRMKGGLGTSDVLGHIELPLRASAWGIPIFGAAMVAMGHAFFGVQWWLGVISIPLVFAFSIIAVNSTGLTSITPGGAIGKLTQLTYGALAPGNMGTNLITAGITSDVTLSASNLLMDIKPGYMLGAKPRQQAIGHVIGVFAGSFAVVPVFYYIFHGDVSLFTSDRLPMPGAQIWRAVAELLAKGFSTLHPTARWGILVGAVLGIAIEWANVKLKGRFPLSGVGLGLATVVTFPDLLSMGGGAVFFWACGKLLKDRKATGYRVLVENRETVAAGVIAGGALIGIILILLETAVLQG